MWKTLILCMVMLVLGCGSLPKEEYDISINNETCATNSYDGTYVLYNDIGANYCMLYRVME
jgi:hypothetical protein